MQYSVIGFPRIGAHRELKFATEKYFRGEISKETLTETVRTQRAAQWKTMHESGASFIPSNDYSLYDGMLDTAFMLNVIPSRHATLGLGETETYFAMGRGYQGEAGDVTACTMKKWFCTNYHYMVPELEDDSKIKLRSERFLDGHRQALGLGIRTKPVVIGPYTFLKLARTHGTRSKVSYVDALAQTYRDIIALCAENGVEWLQIDEPSLVTDMSADDVGLFVRLYNEILKYKKNMRILLQTYFGDIRDAYTEVISLPFDGIGMDFVEGDESERLIENHGFPEDKILFAGVISGRNVWVSDHAKVFDLIDRLRGKCLNIVLSTSCSLLHLPYTVKNESKLPGDVLSHFSFACEKLEELESLCALVEADEETRSKMLEKNRILATPEEKYLDPKVNRAVAKLSDSDCRRAESRDKRRALQDEILALPPLPTTTIGSFPQTGEIRKNRLRYRRGEISESEYNENIKQYIADCVALQEEIGLDVLVHGESERNDMVEYFGENLEGFVFTENAWVQSYGTRGVKPPIIVGDIKRKGPITVEYTAYANTLSEKDVKGMLTGPVTILNWSFPREDISIREMMYQIALAIREEVEDLEAAGVRIIQIDEAALREKLPLRRADWHSKYLDDAVSAFRLCHAGAGAATQIHTHMCYSEFEDIIPEIDDMDADVITFEASRSKLTILDALAKHHFKTQVGPGVYDIHSPRVPSVEEIESALEKMIEKTPVEQIWVNPDCGLKTRGESETKASLINMVEAAKRLREKL